MRSAVIVSTARSPIGRAYRGAFNNTQSQTLGGHVIAEAVKRAGVAPAEIDDVVMGAALQQGAQGFNLARQSALCAGLPDSVAGMTVDRQCSSGLMAIATAAKQIVDDGMQITVGGGLESISLVQNEHMNRHRAQDPALVEQVPALYMAMIETAEIVAERYQISREAQDEYALRSQQRTAAAQQAGRFDSEIVPLLSTMLIADRATGWCVAEAGNADQGRGQPSGHDFGRTSWVEASVCRLPGGEDGQMHHCRQCLPTVRRCLGRGADGGERSRTPRPAAARCISRDRRGRMRARRDGHRAGIRRAEVAGETWAEGG